MYVQVVTYGLAGIDEGEYLDVANDVAPRFAGMPGLLAKVWLGNTEEERYGAVYLWEDRESMERFIRSDLFEAFNPEFAEVAVEDFDVLENLTAVTQPVVQILEPRRQPQVGPPRQTPSRGPAAKQLPVTSKAATKPTKKTAKKAVTVTTAKKAGPAAKGAGRPKKAAAAKKAATKAAKKTAKKAR